MKTQIDHLVVVAQTLELGVQWCEATIGITPGPGGEHAQYGTHNRLFKIATPVNPLAYLEIIAINPEAKRPANAAARRWFDMDDAALQAAVTIEPRLVHFVVNISDLQAACAALKAQGIDRGPAVQASRHSRRGVLQWQITVREDGQRLFNGALPSLIQWGKPEAAEPLRLHPKALSNFRVRQPKASDVPLLSVRCVGDRAADVRPTVVQIHPGDQTDTHHCQ